MAYKEKYGDCNVPSTQNRKYRSQGTVHGIKNILMWPRKTSNDSKRLVSSGSSLDLLKIISGPFRVQKKVRALRCTKPSSIILHIHWVNGAKKWDRPIERFKTVKHRVPSISEAGFKWTIIQSFDDRYNELMEYKAEYGNYNVPCTAGMYHSLQ